MTKYVTVGRRNTPRNAYHTNKDCRKIRQSNIRETSRQEIKYHNLTLCEACSDQTASTGDGTEWKEFTHNLRHGNKDL